MRVSNNLGHIARVMLILKEKRLKVLPFVIAFLLLYCFQKCFCFRILTKFRHVGTFFRKLPKQGYPLTKVKNENLQILMFDSLKEASWCTDCNAKNQNSFCWTIFEKMRLDCPKGPKKLGPFYSFSWIFPKWFTPHTSFLLNWTQWIMTLHISIKKL